MSPRTFLFLQGLASPFMHSLARRLRANGHRALRVNLSGADLAFWPERAVNFRGRAMEWPAFIGQRLRDEQVTDLVLFGDCRPYHKEAIAAARALGVTTHIFEEGYIRPDWITLERSGTNGYSAIPRDPAGIRAAASGIAAAAPVRPLRGSFFNRAVWDVAANVLGMVLWPMFPHYRWHGTEHPFLEYAGWLGRFLRAPAARRHTRQTIARVVDGGMPYYLVPLQLHSDYQIRVHSPYAHPIEAVAEIVQSFADHAPPEAHLLFKLHPLDNELVDYAGEIERLADRAGVPGRWHIVHDGHLPTLLNRSRGVVLINSTIGTQALELGCAVKALGTATYDMPGLTFQGPLDKFWSSSMKPDDELYRAYRRVVIAQTQINGGFFTLEAIAVGARLAQQRMLATPAGGRIGAATAVSSARFGAGVAPALGTIHPLIAGE